MYFENFNSVVYDNRVVTDITARVVFAKTILNQGKKFHWMEYHWSDLDKPEVVAERLYGRADLFWVLFLANEWINPWTDYPLDVNSLAELVSARHADPNAISHYEDTKGRVVNQAVGSPITFREYEEAENEKKRRVKLVPPEQIDRIVQEFLSLLSDG